MVKHDDYMTPYKLGRTSVNIYRKTVRCGKPSEVTEHLLNIYGNSVLMWCVKMWIFLRVPSGIVSSPIHPFLFSRRSLKGSEL